MLASRNAGLKLYLSSVNTEHGGAVTMAFIAQHGTLNQTQLPYQNETHKQIF